MAVGSVNNFLFWDNVDFTGATPPSINNGLNGDNQVWMGRTASIGGLTQIDVMTLTAGTGISLTRAGAGVPGTPGTLTIANTGSMTDLHAARYIVSAGGATDGANFTDIPTAVTVAGLAGGNQTVFIQPGTYTLGSALTMPTGVNLSAFACDSQTPNVTIIGQITGTGSNSFSGIQFQTNAAPIVSLTGTQGPTFNFLGCNINCTNNDFVSNTSTGGPSIKIFNSFGNLATTGIKYFAMASGQFFMRSSHFFNGGSSSTASTASNGAAVDIGNCTFGNNITTSNTSSCAIILCDLFPANGTFTINGTGTNEFSLCRLEPGTSTAISIGAGAICEVQNCVINSSNAAVISGAGTVRYGNLTFAGTSSTITTTTQVAQDASNDAVVVVAPGAYPYTVKTQDQMVIVDTSSARTINLPAAPSQGEKHTVKDNTGGANAHNVTVSGNGNNIDGAATSLLNVNYESETYIFNGTQWNVT